MAFDLSSIFGSPNMGNVLAGQGIGSAGLVGQESPGSGGFLAGLGDIISQNPEKFAIMADMFGKGLAPDNPMAGIGTAMGQSSLANKALAEDKDRQSEIIKAIMGITAPGKPGATSVTVKAGKEGKGKIMTTTSDVLDDEDLGGPVTEATPGAVQTQQAPAGQMINIKDLISSPF